MTRSISVSSRAARVAAVCLAGVACTPSTHATAAAPAAAAPELIAETRLFAFHSNPWVNLHHFLYITARARAGMDATREAVTASLRDTVGFGALSPELRAAWNDALAYYAASVAKRDILFDSSLVTVNNRLAELGRATSVRGTPGLDTGIASTLDRAMPAYRALWWPRHDAMNRRWTDSAVALVRLHGEAVAREEERVFHRSWSSTPVRVDVAPYTIWAGAYTTEHPAHINIRSVPGPENSGTAAFESLFHEVLHTMDDSLFTALTSAFRAAGKRSYRDPTHPFIFFTAGELTRRVFPGYVPFAEKAGMWTRVSDYERILPLLREYWMPYLDGKTSLGEAVTNIAGKW